jgi:hypothetical protein
MKETIGWVLQKILLPLLPFLVGVLVRSLHLGGFSLEVFDGVELSFSMAMLSTLVLERANRLDDRHLRTSIAGVFLIALVAFFFLFSVQLYLKVGVELTSVDMVAKLKNTLQVNSPVPTSALTLLHDPRIGDSTSKLCVLRIWTFIGTVMVVPIAVLVKVLYRLED